MAAMLFFDYTQTLTILTT